MSHACLAELEQAILVPRNAGKVNVALWDIGDSLVFGLSELGQISVYIYSPVSIQGPKVAFVQTSTLASGLHPVSLQNSMLVCKVMLRPPLPSVPCS